MRTSKPIATVSWNTQGFLSDKLNELVASKKLEWWAYIKHKPEPKDDDGNGKEHCHVYMLPAQLVQTVDLREEFKEFDPKHPMNPKGCGYIATSKFDDWYMYTQHDEDYLKYKGLTRMYHYKPEDVVTSDRNMLKQFVGQIDMTSLTPVAKMVEAINAESTFAQFFMSGRVPVQQISQWQQAWNLLYEAKYGHPDTTVERAKAEHRKARSVRQNKDYK